MEYREIVAVTGLGGLYQLVTTKSDGAIVRNVADKSTKFISARQHNVTPLESIEVYTIGDNVRLHNVFQKMQEHEATIPLVDGKTADNSGIKQYFKSIFPEFDEDRVYVSDMKKMLKWYDLLKSNDLLRFDEPAENEGDTAGDEANEEKQEATSSEKSEEADKKETVEASIEETPAKEPVAKKAAKSKKAKAESSSEDADQKA